MSPWFRSSRTWPTVQHLVEVETLERIAVEEFLGQLLVLLLQRLGEIAQRLFDLLQLLEHLLGGGAVARGEFVEALEQPLLGPGHLLRAALDVRHPPLALHRLGHQRQILGLAGGLLGRGGEEPGLLFRLLRGGAGRLQARAISCIGACRCSRKLGNPLLYHLGLQDRLLPRSRIAIHRLGECAARSSARAAVSRAFFWGRGLVRLLPGELLPAPAFAASSS